MAVLQPLRRPLMEGPVLIEATAQRPCRTRREFRMTRFVSHYQVVLGHTASAGHRELEREKVQPGYGLKHGHGNGALPDSDRARWRGRNVFERVGSNPTADKALCIHAQQGFINPLHASDVYVAV